MAACLFGNICFAKIDIAIQGVSKEAEKNIQLYASRWDTLPDPDNSKTPKKIRDLVSKALQPIGYYQPQTQFHFKNKTLHLNINPGPPVVWHDVKIKISQTALENNPKLQQLIETSPFIEGKTINHQVYENHKRTLLSELKKIGYLDATWQKHDFNIDLKKREANVYLEMTAGKRYQIQDVHIHGSALSEQTTSVLIDLEEDHPWYNSDKIGDMYDSLLSSGYFKHTQIDIIPTPPDQASLDISLTDNPRNQITTGVGYGTDTGIRGKLGWNKALVNPRGDSFNTLLNISQIEEELTSQYIIPWPHPQERYLKWDVGWRQEITTDKKTSLFSAGLSFNRSKLRQWQDSYGLNLEKERYRQGDNSTEEITYLYPNTNYFRRSDIYPSWLYSGTLWVWTQAALGIGIFNQDTLFLSAEIGADYSFEFTPRHGGSIRMEFGGIATNDFYIVPLTKRFYTGGDQTVRGYKYNSLSSEDENGELIGGQFLNVLSLEYRYAFKPDWKLAIFSDTGRAFISSNEPFHTGTGFGLRWQLPVGMIAFDAAKPLDSEKDKVRFHIYMSSKI